METAFSDQQYDLFYPPGIEHHWWTLARNRLLAGILRREAGDACSLLEVGCGRGVVVQGLKELGFDIQGVELADVTPMEEAQSLVDSGTDVFDLSEERRLKTTGLLLLDVIEHLPEAETFLDRLDASFPNLSLVIVTVPARQEIWSNYDSTVGHFRRYSLDMLDQLAADLGWSVKQSGYFFRLSYVAMRVMSFLGLDRNTSFEPPGKTARLLHRLMSAVCTLELRMLPRRVRGSSAYVVYRPGGVARST
jgi:hypothetical protein